ncbi:putative membrane protein MmpL [Mycobacteroides abscessus subsp. massiliense]|nr:putative membrane protein MmpL [Mycobacteroides abscessus subsp. massiliense]SLD00823.1 putative membrane protein MmpL [Mycobacteroides abscessus subsp. massiliense]SLD00828.1 putative membrane protein MmpL [Mycobacteroides abscessus subsp. massiliense]SLD00834.1 putative membrane protein MmpL [Mycobacteroides abscessus subsp. massiliense]
MASHRYRGCAVAVTLVPAGIVVASRFGLLEPKRKLRVQRWRAIGTAVVRWPLPWSPPESWWQAGSVCWNPSAS